jgi:MGT family glycosyltransferase
MKLAFISLAAPGHLNPTSTLARQIKARGHDVVLSSLLDTEPFARAANLPFVPLCEKEYPAGELSKILEPLSRMEGRAAMEFTFKLLAEMLQKQFEDLPRVLAACGADAVVVDHGTQHLGLVPMHLGMPFATISNALPFDFTGNTPLFIFDWQHDPTPAGLARNLEGLRESMPIFEPANVYARAYAEKVGLNIDWSDPFATVSKLAWLAQMPREFDFQDAPWPAQFHYTGPFHDGLGRFELDFPWDRLTGEPLIFASMGTLQNGLEHVFSTIAEAVGARPGLQLVLSVGPYLNAAGIKSLPPNAIVVNYAPQIEILERSALCITHAGLNTALESLTKGVPMVAIPITNDQPGVAARITNSKTGAYIPLPQLTVPKLKSSIDRVLKDHAYRDNAQKMKQAIEKTNGLQKACDLLEQAFRLPATKTGAQPTLP